MPPKIGFNSLPLTARIFGTYLAAAAIVYVLERIPVTGVILMIFVGPLWISLILNAMLIHLGIVALRGDVARLWLALPLVLYGGWFGYYGYTQSGIQATIAQLEAMNVLTEPVPPDTDLLFDSNDPSTGGIDSFAVEAKEFIIGGGVFAGIYEIQVIQVPGKPRDCMTAVDRSAREDFFGYFRATPDYTAPGTCAVSRISAYPHHGLHIRRLANSPSSMIGETRVAYTLEMEGADGGRRAVGGFAYGYFTTLSPWPLFWCGCALNSGGPSWNCFFGPFSRQVPYGQDVASEGALTGRGRTSAFAMNGGHARALARLLGRGSRVPVPFDR